MNRPYELRVERPIKSGSSATMRTAVNAVHILLVGSLVSAPITSSITPQRLVELPSINYVQVIPSNRRLEMKTKKFKPSKEMLMKAINDVKNAPDRGSNIGYRNTIASEMEELKKLRRRANFVSKL
ncbi:hypothetical protein SDC9_169899 [bioreactor metagenome]|uniref:Uncharacterized protein n=1 Tax=bioreactor metagenome TaxID=1076179 RepID=A0A645G8R8_9ZZZZ